MARHTPGPWSCVDTSNHAHDYRLTKPDGSPLPVNAPCNDHSEQRANARLIAAAPAMLDALRDLAVIMEHVPEMCGINVSAWRDKARATIAAATGEGS